MAKTQEPGITKIEGAKGSYYRVQIRIKNGDHLSKNFDNFNEAKIWKRKTIAAVKNGEPYETTQMRRLTIGDLIDRFIENELKKLRNHKTMLGHLYWFKQEIGHLLSITFVKMWWQNAEIDSQKAWINMDDLALLLRLIVIFVH